MWKYEKKLEYPINIRNKDLKMAKYLLAQYGGPYGESEWDKILEINKKDIEFC